MHSQICNQLNLHNHYKKTIHRTKVCSANFYAKKYMHKPWLKSGQVIQMTGQVIKYRIVGILIALMQGELPN